MNKINKTNAYAYVDGSYNVKTETYGYGGFLVVDNERFEFSGSSSDPSKKEMRNVAGEIDGALAAIDKAISLNVSDLTIYFDYNGIKAWADGEWRTNKEATKEYARKVNEYRNSINISFVHVKGHSGVEGNENADMLAKKAVGIV